MSYAEQDEVQEFCENEIYDSDEILDEKGDENMLTVSEKEPVS